MTMAKVVQFLEIGNLPKSQLNACPYRKVMIKNLFLSISKSRSARNFHAIFEFSLQISRSHGPPVFRLSLGQPKDRGVVNCKINSFTISSLKHSCFNENEQIWGCKICHNYGHDCCHMGQLKDGGCLNCKRNSITITLWKHSSFNEN